MRIVISELMWPHGVGLLQAAGPSIYDETLWQDRARLRTLLADCVALVVRNQTRVDAELVQVAPALRVVGRLGVGLDNLDMPALRSRGITVVTGGNANSLSVAECTMAMILALARGLVQANASTHAGAWERQRFTGFEICGQTLGLLGLGDVGARVARRAGAFGMRLLAHDPVLTPSHMAVAEFGVTLVSLDTLFAQSDFVSLHLPLTASTRGLVSRERLALMKSSAFLINTSRGGVVDEDALAESLEARRLAGAALDVRDHEPPSSPDRLAALPNVLLTPHIAGLTHQSQDGICTSVAQDVLRVLAGQEPSFPIA
jgi:D-3-phosphoglycerate dehydrogenase/(S)-sulfolactate dehydrogenase